MGRRALLQRSELLQFGKTRETLSRWHVMRLLPYRTEPPEAAGGPGASQVGKPQFQRRRAVLLDRSHLLLGGRRIELWLPAVSHVSSGDARYVPHLYRQHQQPKNDECRVPVAAPATGGKTVG